MSQQPTRPDPSDPASAPASALSRRRVFAGAGTVGALAAVAAVLPSVAPETEPVQAVQQHAKEFDASRCRPPPSPSAMRTRAPATSSPTTCAATTRPPASDDA